MEIGRRRSERLLGSLAALQDNLSRMSALGRIADTRQLDFGSPRLNVRFHQKRSLDQAKFSEIEGPLSATSGHS